MEIVMQTIRIIDYVSNKVYRRDTPTEFSDYVEQLIAYINDNTSIRECRTRSKDTKVINCVLDIINNQLDDEIVTNRVNEIADHMLSVERHVQEKVSNITNVQKGSLIQALLYDADTNKHIYLLAKVEHTDFVDDSDFSFKSGFSKDTNKIWKSCIFDIDDIGAEQFDAKVYSQNKAKYWYDSYLELDQVTTDEANTEKAFKALDATLARCVKQKYPKDYTVLRNGLIAYFKTHNFIDYDDMVKSEFENYSSTDIEKDKMDKMINMLHELPEKYKFDKQFNTVPAVISARIKKTYEVYRGIELKITDAIYDIENVIEACREADGKRYLKIRTTNDNTFKQFFNKE